MSDPDPIRPPLAPPPWLRPDIHAAMQAAYDRELAAGRDRTAAGAAACAILLARVTGAAPSSRDEAEPEAVAAPSGQAPPSSNASLRLDEADVADLVAALAYALRYDARGRPRKGGWDHTADLAAEWLAEHLRRSNFVVLRRGPAPPHRAG